MNRLFKCEWSKKIVQVLPETEYGTRKRGVCQRIATIKPGHKDYKKVSTTTDVEVCHTGL